MEDEDLVMLLYSVILMNQNTRKKSKAQRFWVKPLFGKKEKRSLSKSSSRNEIGRETAILG